uniref:Uncharacterized protein n=1 Tax=Oryza nivara TaxID=4536 RepID=A0A0E0JA41_ORYNI
MHTQTNLMFLIAVVVSLMLSQGESQPCGPSSIDVQQINTGKKVGTLDTVFRVTVENRCVCTVKAVVVQANGFTSSIPVDPKLFRKAGDTSYVVGDGQQIASTNSVMFEYAWSHYFQITPASVQVEC